MKLNKKGFTIVELVIVIAVIAILAAVLIPTFNSVITKANESAALQEAKAAETIVLLSENGDVNNAKYYYVVYESNEYKTPKYVFVYDAATNAFFKNDSEAFITNDKLSSTLANATATHAFLSHTNNADLGTKILVFKVNKEGKLVNNKGEVVTPQAPAAN